MTALDDLANRISKDIPSHEADSSGPQRSLKLQQEQMTALQEASTCLATCTRHLTLPARFPA